MSELQELYQEIILDHNKRPRNFGKMKEYTCDNEGLNPLCGDEVHIFLNIKEGVIKDISFTGQGCAISRASASLMSIYLKGKTIEEAKQFEALVNKSLTQEVVLNDAEFQALEDLLALSGVRKFPARIKCATLPWHALSKCLETH